MGLSDGQVTYANIQDLSPTGKFKNYQFEGSSREYNQVRKDIKIIGIRERQNKY